MLQSEAVLKILGQSFQEDTGFLAGVMASTSTVNTA
jgi:hypothetical protein